MKHITSLFTLLALMTATGTLAQNDVKQDATKNQVQLKLADGTSKYYNTADIHEMTFDNGKVMAGQDRYDNTVAAISFAKAITDRVNIQEAKGWLEAAYVKFSVYGNIRNYNVYVKGGQYAGYTKIDRELVRNYGTYGRADVVGLQAAANYQLKVVPVNGDGTELTAFASETEVLEVKGYSRQGFAFKDGYEPGAYKADGTLKDGAKVLYVTKHNFNTIQLEMVKDNKGNTETYTGLGEIFKAKQKGYDTTPLAIRIIGEITTKDAEPAQLMSDEDGLQLKGNGDDTEMNVTLEGIGDDATFNGFGMTFYNGTKVEMRNIGLVNFNDDGIQLKGTQHAWIHHIDFFYGNAGSAADQKKGDGSLDVKDDSRYCTFSYNHFWDSGKTSLCGMKSESGPNFISYDHNWFDHSDSRHPRVRTMTVHVWNNYYDGVSKIGVGAVKGADIFVESNYFRNSKNPMLISEQGTDGRNGFADDHDGGMIKAYGNVLTGKSATTFRSHKQYPVEFDAYEADTRDEKVPETYKSVVGEYTYNNFDTDATLMYEYTPAAANDVPGIVTGYYGAGRLNHGDLQWTFNNTTDDTSDAIDDELKAAVMGYHTTLIGIMGEEEETSSGGEQGGGDDPAPEGAILASFDGTPSNSMFTVGGNYGDGKITYNGTYYKKGVKFDSKGSITFTPKKDYQMTLILGTAKTGRDVKINGTITTVGGTENKEGSYYEMEKIRINKDTEYVLSKGSAEGLVMLIKLEPVAE